MAVSFVSALAYAGTQLALGAGFIGFPALIGLTATFAALGAVNRALIGKPDGLDTMSGITQNIRQPDASRKMVYGKQRVGGTIVRFETKDSCRNNMNSPYRAGLDTTRTASNEYLDMIIVLASHEVESLEEIYLNDRKIWDINRSPSPWIGSTTDEKFGFAFYDGTQTAYDQDAAHASTWSASHKLLGVSYIYCTMVLDSTVYPNGVPNISCVIKGKKVYDPRTTTTAYSENPALILYDYMRDSDYGLNESASAFDTTALTAAANVCDEVLLGAVENVGSFKVGRTYQITLVAGSSFTSIGAQSNTPGEIFVATGNGSAIGGNGQARQRTTRYSCSGQIDTANPIKQNIENILSSMIGTLQYANGKFIINAYDYDANAVINNAIDNDMLLEPIQIATKTSRKNLYNAVKGRFNSDINNYQVTDYPAQTSQTFATDDGETLYLDLDLPFTTNDIMAQRIARLTMLKSRQQMTVQLVCNVEALQYKVGDNIGITNSRLGWSNKIFEINSFRLSPNPEHGLCCYITATENAASAYDWQSSDQLDFTAGGEVSIYEGMTAPTSLNVQSANVNGDEGFIAGWSAAVGQGDLLYKITYSLNGVTGARKYNTTTYDLQASVPVVADHVGKLLDISVVAISQLDGLTSDPVTTTVTVDKILTTVEIRGLIADPTPQEINNMITSQRIDVSSADIVTYLYVDAVGNVLDSFPLEFESGDLTVQYFTNRPNPQVISGADKHQDSDFNNGNTITTYNVTSGTINVANGKLNFNNSNLGSFVMITLDSLEVGSKYIITVTYDSFTQGQIGLNVLNPDGSLATLQGNAGLVSSAGTYTAEFVAENSATYLRLMGFDLNNNPICSITSLSVTQVTQNALVSKRIFTESMPEDVTVNWNVAYSNQSGVNDTGVTRTNTNFTVSPNGIYSNGKRYIDMRIERDRTSTGVTSYTEIVTASYTLTANIDGVDIAFAKTARFENDILVEVT